MAYGVAISMRGNQSLRGEMHALEDIMKGCFVKKFLPC